MKKTKKILSVFLALLMLFSSVPLSGSIADFSLFILEASAAEIVDSGSFGSLQWTYDDGGTLTISGEGKMVAQQYFEIPWFTKRAELKTVIIEDGVQNIGNFAFQNCTELTSVTVPTSVTSIGKSAFEGCSSFGTIYYAGAESQWNEIEISTELNEALTTATMNYALLAAGTYGENLTWTLNKEGTLTISGEGDMNNYAYNAVPWSAYEAKIKTAVIESGVTSIGNYAFSGYTNLSSVTIPEGVETIGESAFDSCASLQTITLPNSVKHIYDAAFVACTDLTNINLPDGLVSIGVQSFASCYSLTSITIPGTVKNIGQEAFLDCENLKSVTILDGVETIGSSAFSNCPALTSVTIPTSVTYIEEYAFSGSGSIETVYYGGSELQWNEIEIGTNNTELTQATKVFALIDVTPAEDRDGDGYYEIDSASKLLWFAQEVNDGNNSLRAELTADIDLAGTCGEGIGNWVPISNSYRGHFDGQGYTVSNLYMTGDEMYVGLFGYVKGATIENVRVTGSVSSTFYSTYDPDTYEIFDGAAGGVVAHLDGGTIRNCESDVTVTGGLDFGGICGRLSSGIIEDCINRGTIVRDLDSTNGVHYGGVVGYMDGGTVRSCINQGADIVGTNAEIGGIAGQVAEGTVENCINLGNIATTQNTLAGGIAGRIWVSATVRNCGNYGTVTGADAGGITGFNEGIIEHCWNIASVSGTSENVGPIAGVDREGYGTSTNCYYLSDTETADGGRTAEQFASGQVAYELNGSTTTDESVWKQTLGTDIYPTFTGASVYYNTTKNCDGTILNSGYSNSSENIVIHDLKYTASDNIITETCGYDGCTHSAAATLNAPENAVYYGESNAATITYSDGWCGGELTVTYSGTANDGTEYTGVPVKVGEAVASVTIDDVTASINYTVAKATNEWIQAPAITGWTYGEIWNDPTALPKFGDEVSFSYRKAGTIAWTNSTPSDAGIYEMRARVQATDNWELLETTIEFEIKKATTTVDLFDFTPPSNLDICDGLAKGAIVTVKEGIEGVGSVTIKYFKGETELASAPTTVGTYTVKIGVVEGANFFASKDLITDASWTFTFDITDEADHTGITFVSNENGTHNKVCTVCEKVLENGIACSYTDPQKDSTHHWNKCSECDAIDEKIKHSGTDDGDCTTEERCSCGTVVFESKSHSFDSTCDTSCNNAGCEFIRDTEHRPEEDDGDCTTPIRCEVCDTITTEGRTAHTGGEATCFAKALCEVCNTPYGEFSADHKNTTVINKADASCGKDGYTGDTFCNDCEKTVVQGEKIPATGDHKNTEIRNAYDATYEADGYTGDKYCTDCGTLIEMGTAIPKLENPDEPDDNNCDHICHSDSKFVQFFWKIIRFFQKLFKIEQYCDCGVQHW